MDSELKAYLDNITAQMAAIKREIADRETRLLTEFWNWAKSADQRYRQDHLVLAGIDRRVKAIEDRLMELEFSRAISVAQSRPPSARIKELPPHPSV